MVTSRAASVTEYLAQLPRERRKVVAAVPAAYRGLWMYAGLAAQKH